VLAVGLAVATLAVYWPATGYDFVNLDDQVYVSECPPVLAGVTAEGLRWAFTTTAGGAWHPVTWLSLLLDGQFFGPRPGGYHLTNVLLHVANTLLLFGWLYQITQARWRSAMVAALFALHPLHVESVAWISERKDVLSTAFWLLTLIAYGKYASGAKAHASRTTHHARLYYGLALTSFTLGLMSKPMLVTLPCVLLLLDFWPLQRMTPFNPRILWRLVGEKIPFLLLSAVASVVTVWAQRSSDAVASLEWISPGGRLANAAVAYARYLGKTFWPADLAVFYPHPTNWPLVVVLGATALLLAISVVVVQSRQCRPYLAVGWFWFVGTLVPVIGLVQVGGQSLADRYSYVPLIGLFIALVWGASAWFATGGPSPGKSRLAAVMAGLILLLCAGTTIRQLRHWQNSETLFRHALAVTRNNVVAHVNLASTLLDQQRFSEAAEQCELALHLRPDATEALKNLGLALAGLGRWDEAMAQYQRALQIHPDDAQTLNSLGLALANQGKLAEAEEYFRRSLASKADAPEPLSNLGLTLALSGRPEEAMECYRRALQLKPGEVKVLNNLGLALAGQQRWDEALDYYRQALAIRPDSLDALVNSGVALASQGKVAEAIACYRQALQIKPDSLEALINIGIVLARQGERAEAVQYLSEALRLAPDHALVREQLRALGWSPR
jgi:Tfp pilus assembly protein PilF